VLQRRLSAAPPIAAVLEVPRDVLTWIVLSLTAWLAIGVLAARLFGALLGAQEEDDQELMKGRRA
jgi:hypothetical protein